MPLLRNFSTAKVLVSAINKQQGPTKSRIQQQRPLSVSIYIQDQVAAVLANMAANVDCRGEVVKHGGLPLLLQFLLADAPVPATSTDLKAEDYAQMAATERVLQKSAIAISRYVLLFFFFCDFFEKVAESSFLSGFLKRVFIVDFDVWTFHFMLLVPKFVYFFNT